VGHRRQRIRTADTTTAALHHRATMTARTAAMRSVPHLHATTIATTRRRATTTRHRAMTMHAVTIAGRRCQSASASAITMMNGPGMRSGLVTLSHRPATTSAHAMTRATTGQSLGATIVVHLPQIVVLLPQIVGHLPKGMMTARRRATRLTVTLITEVGPWHRRDWKPTLSCHRRHACGADVG